MTPPDSAVRISPSILSADFGRLAEQIAEAEEGGADEIHFDVMDGRFVPAITFGLPVLEAVRNATALPIDVHMMVHDPARFAAGYGVVPGVTMTVHVEALPDVGAAAAQIAAAGMRPAVTLRPGTPLSAIAVALNLVERVLVMSVEPGAGGQPFIPASVARIEALARIRAERDRTLEIAVDGGINVETAPLAAAAGATTLISGSGIFGHPGGVAAGVRAIRAAAEAR